MNSNEFICSLKLLGFKTDKTATLFEDANYLMYKNVIVIVYETQAHMVKDTAYAKAVAELETIKFDINKVLKFIKENEKSQKTKKFT